MKIARRWAVPAAALFGYTVLALLYALQVSVYRASRDEPIAWTDDLLAGMAEWYAWAGLTPLIVWLFRRLSAARCGWAMQLAVHVPCAAMFALAHLALLGGLRQVFQLDGAGWPLTRQIGPSGAASD